MAHIRLQAFQSIVLHYLLPTFLMIQHPSFLFLLSSLFFCQDVVVALLQFLVVLLHQSSIFRVVLCLILNALHFLVIINQLKYHQFQQHKLLHQFFRQVQVNLWKIQLLHSSLKFLLQYYYQNWMPYSIFLYQHHKERLEFLKL